MVKNLNTSSTILAVDDDADVRATIVRTLEREGHQVLEASDAAAALQLVRHHRPEIVILDIMLADMNGFELCTRLRTLPVVNHVPIMFLSVYDSAQHVAKALDCGGDDYLRKPFAPRELSARIRALLRRAKLPYEALRPSLILKPEAYSVLINNQLIALTPTEFSLLEFLCHNQDQHHTANDLLEKLWQYPPGGGDTALVRNHIRNLRRKIESDPDHPAMIVSLHGRGYTIEADILHDAVETAS